MIKLKELFVKNRRKYKKVEALKPKEDKDISKAKAILKNDSLTQNNETEPRYNPQAIREQMATDVL